MNAKEFLKLCVSSTAFLAAPALAQDEGEAPEVLDEAITVLDQTVPVADDPVESELPEMTAEDEETAARQELSEAFLRFSELRSEGVLDEAENVAKRVIELSIRLNGVNSIDTAKALNNLAVVQHQTGDFSAAALNFEQAINIIRDVEDQLSNSLINPLKGLGAAQLASNRPDLAFGTYTRAMHVSHVNDGPHNLSQVDILEALAETNLRLGEVEEARNLQDIIYSLHLRYYEDDEIQMVPPLMRLARWQHRTGYLLDERATYRRVIRIIEHVHDDNDIALIEPLTLLGQSYYYADQSQSAYVTTTAASGEMYFKRAVRIAEDNPDSTWELMARTKLSLGDYYTYRSDLGRARKAYRDVWALLSADEERLDLRREELEGVNILLEDPLPRYIGGATVNDTAIGEGLREGRILVSYNVSSRGRVTGLQVIEATPVEFVDMQRLVTREVRDRIFRPRFEDGEPVESPGQSFSHEYFYLQEALDELRAEADGS
ncbi:MAG: tetratricopeptide repeat protein [Woeseiaceae bacterium]|nr:tetratricopeptide repeat protein [Woeseiaceae bacterium]